MWPLTILYLGDSFYTARELRIKVTCVIFNQWEGQFLVMQVVFSSFIHGRCFGPLLLIQATHLLCTKMVRSVKIAKPKATAR